MKAKTKFQKILFKKMDLAMAEYKDKDDIQSATAFLIKIKDKFEYILKSHSKKDEDVLIKELEDHIENIKNEVHDIIKRQDTIPSYIGFIHID